MKQITTEVEGKLLTGFSRLHFMRMQEILKPYGLYPGQPHVIMTLMDRGGLTQTQIAEAVGRRPATITVMLSRLEESGLVTRDVSAEDRRCARVNLTEKGRSLGEELQKSFLSMDQECFDGFSAEELDALSDFTVRMSKNLAMHLPNRKVKSMFTFFDELNNKEKTVAAQKA